MKRTAEDHDGADSDRVGSVPLPAVEAETAMSFPGRHGTAQSENPQMIPVRCWNRRRHSRPLENTVEEEDNTAMTTAQAPATVAAAGRCNS